MPLAYYRSEMKQLTLKHIVLIYAITLIGCGVAPESNMATDFELDGVTDVQFAVKSDHGGGDTMPVGHGGGDTVSADHGDGDTSAEHGGGDTVKGEHGGGDTVIPDDALWVDFNVKTKHSIDVILIDDKYGERSIHFTQNKDGKVTATFYVSDMDFGMTIMSGEKRFVVKKSK